MKGFLVLLCCIAAAQARSTALQRSSRALAQPGENPWLVHLRVAVSTSGFLDSGAGTLINEGWVLTAHSLIERARFVWVRYGVVTVWNPSLVTEVSEVNLIRAEDSPVGLLRLNRVVHSSLYIAPISLYTGEELPSERGSLCGFGANEEGKAGEQLQCQEVSLKKEGSDVYATGEAEATEFDLGAPLVSNGELIGVLVRLPQEGDTYTAAFVAPEAFKEWVEEQIN